ncbi:MAG: DNA repair protein RecO [Phycisphaerales bacterium]|nr:DNA repair protein RecO [Phycisphaerales bacterium]
MTVFDDEAVCIRHWDYSETSQTVGLFSKQYGIVRAIAKGSRRERAAFSGGVDLLTHADLSMTLNPGSDLATLTQWSLRENFPKIRSDVQSNKIAYFAADLVGRLLEVNDPHPNVFGSLLSLLRTIGTNHSECGDPTEPTPEINDCALLDFQWILLREAGYQPILGYTPESVEATHFDPRDGGRVTALPTPTTWRVRPSTIAALQRVKEHESGTLLMLDREVVGRANRLLAAYVRDVIGEEPFTLRRLFGVLPKPNM